MACGRRWTTRWPSPGAEEDLGKGDAIVNCVTEAWPIRNFVSLRFSKAVAILRGHRVFQEHYESSL